MSEEQRDDKKDNALDAARFRWLCAHWDDFTGYAAKNPRKWLIETIDPAMKAAGVMPSAELPIMQFSGASDPTDWSPHAEFDSLTFGSYTDAKKAEVLFNRLIRELNEAAAAIENAESDKNWLRAQRDVAEEKLGVPSATLAPIPTKLPTQDRTDQYGSGYVDGWNACVDRALNATDRSSAK